MQTFASLVDDGDHAAFQAPRQSILVTPNYTNFSYNLPNRNTAIDRNTNDDTQKAKQKTSKEAIVGRAVLCQLNKTIIVFDSNFGYLRK